MNADKILLFLVVGALAACSSSKDPAFPDEASLAADKQGDAPPAGASKEKLPPGTVARNDLDSALMRGPGWLLGKVQPEEVLRQNKFVGWRLIFFPQDWDGSGLQPGDVITEVNGTSLERPEDLFAVYLKAAEADEIKIGFERDGKPATTVVKIHGPIQPETKRALEGGVMPAPGQGGGPSKSKADRQRFETKVIPGGNAEPIETSEY